MVNELIQSFHEDFRQKLDAYNKTCCELKEKATRYEEKASELMAKAQKCRGKMASIKPPSGDWVAGVVEPLAKEIGNRLNLESKVYGPQGLGCRVHMVFGSKEAEDEGIAPRWWFTLQPAFQEGSFELFYESDEETDRYPQGSLGALNGLNKVTKPLPDDIDQIIELIKALNNK